MGKANYHFLEYHQGGPLFIMVHQIGDRLRDQNHRFSGELSTGLGKVVSRSVEEMIFGVSASGSVVLTRIARSLEEPISLHDTHKRLSRNLGNRAIRGRISTEDGASG